MNKKFVWISFVVVAIALGMLYGLPKPDSSAIKIGALLPLTGKFANLGEDIKNGLELARKEVRETKGIEFDFIYEDSAADPKVALPAAQKLIRVDNVSYVFGGPGSSGNLAVAPLFEQNKVIFTAISSTPKLNDSGEYIFKLQPDIEGEVTRSAKHIFDTGLRKLGIIYDTASDTNTTGKNLLIAEFTKLGGTVVSVEGYDSKTVTDFRTILTKIRGHKPDSLFFLAIEKVGGLAVKQAREIGLAEPIFGWSPFESVEFLNTAGSFAEGVVITGMPFSCENGNELMKTYCQAYQTTYNNRIPLQYSAHAYDLIMILARVVAENKNRTLNTEEVRAALTSKEYEGASGDLQFDAQGNIRDKAFVFRIVKDGKFVDLK